MTALLRRVRRSPFADHLRAATRAAFWPAVVCSGLFLGLFVLWATRGTFVDWTGFHPIPTGSVE
jgi:hypothetical protein